MFHNLHNRKNYALICAKLTINIIVGRLWVCQTKVLIGQGWSVLLLILASLLASAPLFCHCLASVFRLPSLQGFLFSFHLFVHFFYYFFYFASVCFSTKLPLPRCGVGAYRHLLRQKFLSVFLIDFGLQNYSKYFN